MLLMAPAEQERRSREIGTRPLDRSDNPNRTHRLRPPLDSKRIDGVLLPQWQHEITRAGRVHQCPNRESWIVWVTMVDPAHPKVAE